MPHMATCAPTIAAIALLCVPGMARAQDTSAWDAEPHAAARLIAGAAQKSADVAWLRAGIEIRLDSGWKTYWRYPGDSGVPPTLDFAGSENVKSVTVLWPAPVRFADGAGGQSIGYHGDVVLPLRILANDATKPAALHLKLSYAVCGNLCVPVEAELELVPSAEHLGHEILPVRRELHAPPEHDGRVVRVAILQRRSRGPVRDGLLSRLLIQREVHVVVADVRVGEQSITHDPVPQQLDGVVDVVLLGVRVLGVRVAHC